jgi:hypothetical protein
LSGTSLTQPIDLARVGSGLRVAPSLGAVGTIDASDPTGPLVGQNDITTQASLAVSGGGSTEGVQHLSGSGSQTFWVVSDGTTSSYYVGLPNPPTNTALTPVTRLDVAVLLPDTTWTAAGGADLALGEQTVAPTDLVSPDPADRAAAPLRFATTANPATAAPLDLSASCWPGTATVDPAPSGAVVPTASAPFATATVPKAAQAPTCLDTAITVTAGAIATVDALAHCSDPSGTLVGSTVTVTAAASSGATTVDPVTGVITYDNTSLAVGSDAFAYTVSNGAGLSSAPAVVTLQIVAACAPAAGSCPTGPVVTGSVGSTPAGLTSHQPAWFVPLGDVTLRGDYVVASGALQPWTITDARGSNLGWSVTATVSDFTDAAGSALSCTTPSRTCIPATNLGWVPSASVISTSIPGSTSQVIPGPSLSDTLAPWLVPLNGTGTGSVLCFAPPGQGGGTYRCDARLFLAIPASAGEGSYSADLTMTIS